MSARDLLIVAVLVLLFIAITKTPIQLPGK